MCSAESGAGHGSRQQHLSGPCPAPRCHADHRFLGGDMFQDTYTSLVASGTSPKAAAFHQGISPNHLGSCVNTHTLSPALEILSQPPSSLYSQRNA